MGSGDDGTGRALGQGEGDGLGQQADQAGGQRVAPARHDHRAAPGEGGERFVYHHVGAEVLANGGVAGAEYLEEGGVNGAGAECENTAGFATQGRFETIER